MPNRGFSSVLTPIVQDILKPGLAPSYQSINMMLWPYRYETVLPSNAAFTTAIGKVLEYAQMPEGWDGDGASKFSAEATNRTKHALDVLSWQLPAPEIAPNANGTFSLEWETNAGTANIEIGRTRYAGYISTPGAPTRYFDEANKDVDFALAAVVAALLFRSLEPSKPITHIEVQNVWR